MYPEEFVFGGILDTWGCLEIVFKNSMVSNLEFVSKDSVESDLAFVFEGVVVTGLSSIFSIFTGDFSIVDPGGFGDGLAMVV